VDKVCTVKKKKKNMKNNNNFKQRPHPKLYVDKEPGYVEKLKDFHIK